MKAIYHFRSPLSPFWVACAWWKEAWWRIWFSLRSCS